MRRVAFTMRLKPGFEAEYERRHDAIWPELSEKLRAAGVSDYSIFLDPETLTLFAVQKVADVDGTASLPLDPVVRRWWEYMKDIMDTNPDASPVQKDLREVFHLD